MKLVNCNSIGWDQKKSYAGEDDDEDSDEDDDDDSDEGCFGFDVVVSTDVAGCGILKPFRGSFEVDEPVSNLLKYCAELAVKSYNKNY
ncbi:hypothetical protein C3L33_03939, partial [Rhododendron williamsianum]